MPTPYYRRAHALYTALYPVGRHLESKLRNHSSCFWATSHGCRRESSPIFTSCRVLCSRKCAESNERRSFSHTKNALGAQIQHFENSPDFLGILGAFLLHKLPSEVQEKFQENQNRLTRCITTTLQESPWRISSCNSLPDRECCSIPFFWKKRSWTHKKPVGMALVGDGDQTPPKGKYGQRFRLAYADLGASGFPFNWSKCDRLNAVPNVEGHFSLRQLHFKR